MDEEKFYGTENDVMFKCLFGAQENEKITKDFLEFVTNEKIESITLDHKLELEKLSPKSKEVKTDLRAKDEKLRNYLLEMQNRTNQLLPKRFLSYLCRAYVADLKIADKYSMLKQTVLIVIMNESFPQISKNSNYHTQWLFKEKNTNEVLSEDLQIHIIELPKYKNQKKKTNKMEPWIEFLIDPLSEGVKEMARSKEELREAVEMLKKLNADEEVRRIAEAEEMEKLDRNTEIYLAKEEGLAEGRASGLVEGRAEGRVSGIAEGKSEEKVIIVKRLLKIGIDKKTIINATNLSEDEIEKIEKQMSEK